MTDDNPLSIGEGLLSNRRKISKLSNHDNLDEAVKEYKNSFKRSFKDF